MVGLGCPLHPRRHRQVSRSSRPTEGRRWFVSGQERRERFVPLCQGECLISQADGDIQFSAKSGHVFAQCVDLCGADAVSWRCLTNLEAAQRRWAPASICCAPSRTISSITDDTGPANTTGTAESRLPTSGTTLRMGVPSRTSAPTPVLDQTNGLQIILGEVRPITPLRRGSSTGSDHCSSKKARPY